MCGVNFDLFVGCIHSSVGRGTCKLMSFVWDGVDDKRKSRRDGWFGGWVAQPGVCVVLCIVF